MIPAAEARMLKSAILGLGLDRVGFLPAGELTEHAIYRRWLAAGCAADMAWLESGAEARRNPRAILPEARSVIMVSLNYFTPEPAEGDGTCAAPPLADASRDSPEPRGSDDDSGAAIDATPPGQGLISRYARGRDYHKVLRQMLKRVATLLHDDWGARHTRVCVDSAPLLERSLAARAGLGWIGRNGLLIDEELGSWTFLGALLCDLDLPADIPVPERCGSCRACLDACPTDAFRAPVLTGLGDTLAIPPAARPNVDPSDALAQARSAPPDDDATHLACAPGTPLLDARRCLSYLTIEHRGEITGEFSKEMSPWIFGCDICQTACPWNRRVPATRVVDFAPRPGLQRPDLRELGALDEDAFLARFAGTPVMRAGVEALRRNARIVLAAGKRQS